MKSLREHAQTGKVLIEAPTSRNICTHLLNGALNHHKVGMAHRMFPGGLNSKQPSVRAHKALFHVEIHTRNVVPTVIVTGMDIFF